MACRTALLGQAASRQARRDRYPRAENASGSSSPGGTAHYAKSDRNDILAPLLARSTSRRPPRQAARRSLILFSLQPGLSYCVDDSLFRQEDDSGCHGTGVDWEADQYAPSHTRMCSLSVVQHKSIRMARHSKAAGRISVWQGRNWTGQWKRQRCIDGGKFLECIGHPLVDAVIQQKRSADIVK